MLNRKAEELLKCNEENYCNFIYPLQGARGEKGFRGQGGRKDSGKEGEKVSGQGGEELRARGQIKNGHLADDRLLF
jgi:hypothetical protein